MIDAEDFIEIDLVVVTHTIPVYADTRIEVRQGTCIEIGRDRAIYYCRDTLVRRLCEVWV